MNWVCDDAWKPATGNSIFYVGGMIGTILFGAMADRHVQRFIHILIKLFLHLKKISNVKQLCFSI